MSEIWNLLKKNTNARIYLIFGFLNSLWFIEASWYFYWGTFLTYTQIGLVFSLLVIIGLVAEIPSGVFADWYGRRASVIMGAMLLGIGAIGVAATHDGWGIIVGTSIMSIGRAFISGALEALVYDSLVADKLEQHWDRLVSTKFQASLLAYIIAVPIGGYLYTVFFRLPNILEVITLFIALFVALKLKESKIATPTIEKKIFSLTEMGRGFGELWKANLRPFIIPSFLIITIFELYDWGLSKPAMALSFGLDSRGQSIVYTLLAIANVGFVGLVPRIRKIWGDYWGLRALNLISGFAFLISTLNIGFWGISTLFMLEMTGNLGDPWTSIVVNQHSNSRYRATTISTLAFLTRLPHLAVNVMAGAAIDQAGIGKFHWGLGIVILAITALTCLQKRVVDT